MAQTVAASKRMVAVPLRPLDAGVRCCCPAAPAAPAPGAVAVALVVGVGVDVALVARQTAAK